MFRRRKHLVLLVASVAVIISLIYLKEEFSNRKPVNEVIYPKRYKDLEKYLDTGKKKAFPNKTILLWTKFFSYKFWRLPEEVFQEGYLKKTECPVTNCVFTLNRTYLQHPHDFDAILFHTAETNRDLSDIPLTRRPRQVYIMVSKECPSQIWHNMSLERSFYNLTMSYRLDSDITWTYGAVFDKLSKKEIAPSRNVQWREPDHDFKDSKMIQQAKEKTKTAAWFVSHCNSFSKRDELVEKLQEYIDVDIYGKCGTLECERFSAKCDELLNTTYMFYFAFENTLCIDYVTEKAFDTMKNFVIPVIYSGAELSNFLPPKSYIDAESFETAENLANYLKFLSNNPDEYIKYFWWRKYYKIVTQDAFDPCKVCKKLNEPKFKAKRQVYTSIKNWFYKDVCHNPKIKF